MQDILALWGMFVMWPMATIVDVVIGLGVFEAKFCCLVGTQIGQISILAMFIDYRSRSVPKVRFGTFSSLSL